MMYRINVRKPELSEHQKGLVSLSNIIIIISCIIALTGLCGVILS